MLRVRNAQGGAGNLSILNRDSGASSTRGRHMPDVDDSDRSSMDFSGAKDIGQQFSDQSTIAAES